MVSNRNSIGVYVMQVAAMLTGMHPQTLRKYERAGLIMPSRHYMVRLYSDEDIARLKLIKHLVEDVGLNLAGVELVLRLRDRIMQMKEELASFGISSSLEEHFASVLDEMLNMLGSG